MDLHEVFRKTGFTAGTIWFVIFVVIGFFVLLMIVLSIVTGVLVLL